MLLDYYKMTRAIPNPYDRQEDDYWHFDDNLKL